MGKFSIGILATMAALVGTSSSAYAGEIYEYPTSWRLQNYSGNDDVLVWFTSVSNCFQGGLTLVTANQDQKGRLWSLILTAKASNKKVGIFYTGCSIDSFYIDN